MTTYQHQNGAPQGDPQLELQGIFGKLIGSALGGMAGKHFGGKTGQTIGKIAGGAIGAFAPFDAGPAMAGAPTHAAEAPTDLEMQGFWSVVRKIGGVAGKAVDTGRNLGLFQADASAPQASEQPTELEMQGFWEVVRKVGKVAGKAVDTGRNLGLFQAQPAQGSDGIAQALATVQQAMPAIQQLAAALQQQQGQQAAAPGNRLN
jgi:diadenosine tetraphosphate (Ap4A) HIT family hydrolase